MAFNNSKFIGVAVCGAGVVGGGVCRLLTRQSAQLRRLCGGRPLRLVRVVKRNTKQAAHLPPQARAVLGADWRAAVADPNVHIVVELMGGGGEAAKCIAAALAAGKRVVTANKALLAKAQANAPACANVAHEAAVAGCIPIVKILREALAGDKISEIYGVINGTCNYILTVMEARRLPFAAALLEAQKLGYAEANPALDINGADTAHKLTLLARLAFGAPVALRSIPTAGIENFDARDIAYAKQFNLCVKLLAVGKLAAAGRLQLRVCPALIPRGHLLAAVNGAKNAVLVRGAFAGESLFYGAGAGGDPTAVAVVADILDIARRQTPSPAPAPPPRPPAPCANYTADHYLRLRVVDRPGALAAVTRILAQEGISIEAMRQNESLPGKPVDVVVLLHAAAGQKVARAAAKIRRIAAARAPVVVMPIERLQAQA